MAVGRIIDVSSDQHLNNSPINWSRVAAAGVTGVIVKATQGTDYVNPWMQRDVIAAQAAGLVVCCYHYADMGDPVAEAIYFLKTASRFARVLDFETNTDVAWARTFLETLGLPATECMIYGSASSLKDFYQQLPAMAWVAAYEQLYPGWGVCWQFTDAASIPGITGPCDEDKWAGSEDQYDLVFQAPIIPPPIPPSQEENETVTSLIVGGQLHVWGVVNNVAYHWWQEIGPPASDWHVETMPI